MLKILAVSFFILMNLCLGELEVPCRGVVEKNSTTETQLVECLFKNYKDAIRPVNDSNQTVKVNMSFYIVAVAQVYDKENAVLLETYIGQKWYDHRLRWNPKDYGNIRRIFVNYWNIWEPELVVWDNRDSTGTIVEGKKAIVSYKGEVEWTSQIRLSTYCWMDHAKFPFDEQICRFQFQHHVYDTSLVNPIIIDPLTGKMSEGSCYSIHAEWNVKECNIQVENTKWKDLNLSCISLEILMERQYSYHYHLIVIPSILVVMFTLSLLWLPHESSQRFAAVGGMLFVILLTNFVLQQFLPPSIGEVPVIASYLLYSIVILIIVFIISLVTYHFHERNPKVEFIPEIMKKMFFNAVIGKATCVLITPFHYMPNASLENKTWNEPAIGVSERETGSFGENTDKLLGDIRRHLETLSIQSDREHPVNEWKQLALIIDRLSFYIFFIINIIITTALYAH